MSTVRKATAEPKIELAYEGIGPNPFARMLKSKGLLAERVANAGSDQEIGKLYFRPHLRKKYGDVHEKHSSWHLTHEMQLDLMNEFGTDRAKAYVTRQRKARAKK